MLSLKFQSLLPTPLQLDTLPMPLPQLPLLDTLPTLLPQPSLLKRCLPKLSSSVPKTKSERDLYIPCAVRNEHYLRHTRLYWNNNYRKVGVSWWLFLLVFLRTTSNVSLALQYDITTSLTSGSYLLLNVPYFRYRRELFINKSM